MKIKRKQILNRSFKSKAPDWITPIYNTVQIALNSVLANPNYTHKLIKIDLKHYNDKGNLVNKQRGTLWTEIQTIIGNPLVNKINNSAWYNRILMTNIISLIKSHQQQVIIYQLLKDNNFKIDTTLRNNLTQEKLFPTNVELENLTKAKDIPDLPNHSTLKLNYAFADKQLFTMDSQYNCEIQTLSKKEAKKQGVSGWKSFQIYLPSYIRTNNLIKICKPIFVFDKKINKIICQVPYQLTAEEHSDFKNILGIDLGKVKFYSGTVLYSDNTYSNEYIPSNRLNKLNQELANLNNHINSVYEKMQRAQPYFKTYKCIKQIRRYFDYKFSREKRTRLKKIIEWQIANEILDIALKQKCKEIHLENLTWVNNIGGKWDFSLICTHINYLAEIHGIKIKLINPKNTSKQNPVTKELGQVNQRNIVFKDLTVDRDQLASLNIALSGTNRKITELHSRPTMQTRYKSRRRHNYLAKKQVLTFNKNNQIVLFLHKIVKHTFTFMKLNKNISYLDNNLAKRNDLSLSKLIILTN